MAKPTREEAKKCLVRLDKIQDWLNENLDYVMDFVSEEDEDSSDIQPLNFDRDKLESDFYYIREALRYCL
jgi:hypothetical protein